MLEGRRLGVVLALLAACSSSQEDDQPCVAELTTIVVPALEHSLQGGTAESFHRATARFQHATMCGPDVGAFVRDWEAAVREPDATKAGSLRREALTRVQTVLAADDWKLEAHALAPVLAKARTK